LVLRRSLEIDFNFLSFFDITSNFSWGDFGLFPTIALDPSDSVSDSAWVSFAGGGTLHPKKHKSHTTGSLGLVAVGLLVLQKCVHLLIPA